MKKHLLRGFTIAIVAALALAFAPILRTVAHADDEINYFDGFYVQGDETSGYTIVGYDGTDTDVVIPDSFDGVHVAAIDPYVFGSGDDEEDDGDYEDPLSIASITFSPRSEADLTAYGPILLNDNAFADMSDLVSVDLSNSTELEGDEIFSNDTSLETFIAHDNPNLGVIDGVLFIRDQGTNKLTILAAYPPAKTGTDYTIPPDTLQLSVDCFDGCESLQSITLSDGLQKDLDPSTFSSCTQLSAVVASATSANYSSVGGVLLTKDGTTLVYFPAAKSGDYAIPSGVTALQEMSFDWADKITSVSIPASLIDLDKNNDDAVNPFWNCPLLTSITVDPSNISYKTVDGVLFKLGVDTVTITKLIAYPPGRTATDTSIYSVKKPAADKPATAAKADKPASVPAGVFSGKALDAYAKAERAKKPQVQAKAVISVVKNAKNMTGNYIVPDSVEFISQGAFSNTTLAVVTFRPTSAIDNIQSGAFPSDGSVSISAPASLSFDIKGYAQDNGIPFIETVVVDGELAYELNDTNDGLVVTGPDINFTGTDVTIPQKAKYLGVEYNVVGIGDGAFAYDPDNGVDITHVAIPSGVTWLGNGAFANCSNLAGTLKLPDTITSIGDDCFASCGSLDTVILPANLISLGDEAFTDCYGLTEINLPSKLATIGDSCFADDSFETVVIPDSVQTIGIEAFEGCGLLTSVTLPSGLQVLKEYTFMYCGSLESISIPESVETIGFECFLGCNSLTSVSIPKKVEAIGVMAFALCDNITQFSVADGNAKYYADKGVLFGVSGSALIAYPTAKAGATYDIPAGIRTVYPSAFSGNCPVETINIPSSVVSAPDAFISTNLKALVVDPSNTSLTNYMNDGVLYNKAITTVLAYPMAKADTIYNIPATVTSLNNGVLQGCQFQTVTIPAGLTKVGIGVFAGCYHLQNINVVSANKVFASKAGVLYGNKKYTAILRFPSGRTGEYSIPSGVTTVMDYAFYDCSLSTIYFPASVTTLGVKACAMNLQLEAAAFFGNPYTAKYDEDKIGPFDGSDYFTVYYHITKAARWSHFEDYDSEPFIMLTLNYQDSQPTYKYLAPADGGKLYSPDDPDERENCTFTGWYKDAACTQKNYFDFDVNTVKNDITLFAKWQIDTPPTVTVEPQDYTTIKISWDSLANASGYVVQRAVGSPTGKYTTVATAKASATFVLDKKASTGVKYYYIVQAFTQAGKNKFYGSFSDPQDGTTVLLQPVLSFPMAVNYTSVKLYWAKVPGATTYKVYRSLTDDFATAKAIKTVKTNSYTDGGALLNTYYYWVVAYRGAVPSEVSDSKSAETQLLPPPGLKLVRNAAGVVTVSWKATPGAMGYEVYASTPDDTSFSPLTLDCTKTSYTASGLTVGQTYYFNVVAYRLVNSVKVEGMATPNFSIVP